MQIHSLQETPFDTAGTDSQASSDSRLSRKQLRMIQNTLVSRLEPTSPLCTLRPCSPLISDSIISLTNPSKSTCLFQPNLVSALVQSPQRSSTSAGRKYLERGRSPKASVNRRSHRRSQRGPILSLLFVDSYNHFACLGVLGDLVHTLSFPLQLDVDVAKRLFDELLDLVSLIG